MSKIYLLLNRNSKIYRQKNSYKNNLIKTNANAHWEINTWIIINNYKKYSLEYLIRKKNLHNTTMLNIPYLYSYFLPKTNRFISKKSLFNLSFTSSSLSILFTTFLLIILGLATISKLSLSSSSSELKESLCSL